MDINRRGLGLLIRDEIEEEFDYPCPVEQEFTKTSQKRG